MTREELLACLHHLENHDPRRDPRHLDCSVWIWERDQVEAALRAFGEADPPNSAPKRPPLGPLATQALDLAFASSKVVPLWIAVELTEAGYVVERWPEHWQQGKLWGCVVSDRAGGHISVQVRVSHKGLAFFGLPDLDG